MRHMHRILVTSSVYRMSSPAKGREIELAKDPDNRMIWRRVPIRLDAEAIRNSLLSLSHAMDWTRGGPSIPSNAQGSSKRRSLYFFHSNNAQDLFLTTFDGAAVQECYRREQAVVHQQGVAMMNSTLSQEAAKGIVALLEGRLRESGTDSDSEFVWAAFRYVTGVPPSAAAVESSLKALEQGKQSAASSAAALFAKQAFLWVLLNHTDFGALR